MCPFQKHAGLHQVEHDNPVYTLGGSGGVDMTNRKSGIWNAPSPLQVRTLMSAQLSVYQVN